MAEKTIQLPDTIKVPDLRLCKDCVHFQQIHTYYDRAICGRRAKIVNPVNGNVADDYYDRAKSMCSSERGWWWPFSWLFRKCGTRGRYWKGK